MTHEAFVVVRIIHGPWNVSGVKRTIVEILNVIGLNKNTDRAWKVLRTINEVGLGHVIGVKGTIHECCNILWC